MDELTRASGDKFDALIKGKLGNGDKPIFRHIGYINSASPRNHLVQICDLLLGAILNENYPTKNKLKNRFREFVKLELKLPTLKENYWKNKLKKTADKQHPKIQHQILENALKMKKPRLVESLITDLRQHLVRYMWLNSLVF